MGAALGQLKMACLRRAGRTAPARMTARVSTALGRRKREIALVVVFGAHCLCPDDGPRGHSAGPAEDGMPLASRAHGLAFFDIFGALLGQPLHEERVARHRCPVC